MSEIQNEAQWAKIQVSKGVAVFLLEVLGDNLFFCVFQLLEAVHNFLDLPHSD